MAECFIKGMRKIEAPPHYTYGSKECIEFIDDVGAKEGYLLGNAVKYIFRHMHKGDQVGDIRKAIKCLQMYAEMLDEMMDRE